MSLLLKLKKRTDVSALEDGAQVVVEGRISAPREMTVPGTQIRCLAYWLLTEAWQHGARGRGRKMWVPSNQQLRTEGFYLDDGTGKVWICGLEAENGLDLIGGVASSGPMGKKGKARYMCRTISTGDLVRVQGSVGHPKGSEPGETLVVRPGAKGLMKVMLRKRA